MIEDRLALIKQKGFMPELKFGQNFLCDEDIIRDIVDLGGIGKEDMVLEIGPGLGSISVPITELTDSLTVVEIDKRLATFLQEEMELKANIISSDFLKLKDYGADKFDVVVSNLPYYVMTDIMKKLMGECTHARKMVFMVEEDALPRLFAEKGSKQYGPLAVLCALYGELRKEFTVPRGCFIPSPNTTSCVISLTSGENELSEGLVKFINRAFAMRRKKLVNNIKEAAGVLDELGLPSDVRAEQLEPVKFIELYNAIIGNSEPA